MTRRFLVAAICGVVVLVMVFAPLIPATPVHPTPAGPDVPDVWHISVSQMYLCFGAYLDSQGVYHLFSLGCASLQGWMLA
jgi:hypothetical protein